MNQKIDGFISKSARNKQIILDYKAGMTSAQLAEKWGLARNYAQKIGSDYGRHEKMTRADKMGASCLLYGKRDSLIINAYKGL